MAAFAGHPICVEPLSGNDRDPIPDAAGGQRAIRVALATIAARRAARSTNRHRAGTRPFRPHGSAPSRGLSRSESEGPTTTRARARHRTRDRSTARRDPAPERHRCDVPSRDGKADVARPSGTEPVSRLQRLVVNAVWKGLSAHRCGVVGRAIVDDDRRESLAQDRAPIASWDDDRRGARHLRRGYTR